MDFDAKTRKLNRWYDIQLALKLDFLHDTLPWNVMRHDENIFVVSSASYSIAHLSYDCITYDINMTLMWWMGVAKVDISLLILLFLRLFEYGHPLVCLKYWQYWYLNIDVLKTHCSRFLATSVEHLFRRAPFDDCFWQYIGGKSICPFSTNFDSKKNLPTRLFEYQAIKIFFNNLLQILCNLTNCKES